MPGRVRQQPGVLRLAHQVGLMRRHFPAFRYRRAEHAWYGSLQPTPTSRRYPLKVQYRPGDRPRVWVLGRALDAAAHDLHRYRDGSLCLYHPDDGDWRRGRPIATTIVPWAAEWLFYYECWLRDPERIWRGPEAPHGTVKEHHARSIHDREEQDLDR